MKTRGYHKRRKLGLEDRKLPITVSLTFSEMKRIDNAARKKGKNRSEFVLWAVRNYV